MNIFLVPWNKVPGVHHPPLRDVEGLVRLPLTLSPPHSLRPVSKRKVRQRGFLILFTWNLTTNFEILKSAVHGHLCGPLACIHTYLPQIFLAENISNSAFVIMWNRGKSKITEKNMSKMGTCKISYKTHSVQHAWFPFFLFLSIYLSLSLSLCLLRCLLTIFVLAFNQSHDDLRDNI